MKGESSADVPTWWVEEARARMTRLSDSDRGARTKLAEKIASRTRVTVNAARARVSRFFSDDPVQQKRTAETVRLIGDVLAMPPYEFRARSREEAEAMAAVQRDPGAVSKALLRDRMAEEEARSRTLAELLGGGGSPRTGDTPKPRRRRE